MCCDLSIILGFVAMMVTAMVPLGKDTATKVKQVEIGVRYEVDCSAENPVSQGVGMRRLGDPDYRREEISAIYRVTWVHHESCESCESCESFYYFPETSDCLT